MKKPTLLPVLVCLALAACRSADQIATLDRAENSGVCPVHRQNMVKEPVPLFYGYYVSEDDGPSAKIRAANFPFAQWFAMDGGPIVDGESKKTIALFHCVECEQAKLDWIARHPASKWGKEELAAHGRVSQPRVK